MGWSWPPGSTLTNGKVHANHEVPWGTQDAWPRAHNSIAQVVDNERETMALRRIVGQPGIHPFCPIGELLTVVCQPVNELEKVPIQGVNERLMIDRKTSSERSHVPFDVCLERPAISVLQQRTRKNQACLLYTSPSPRDRG